MGSDEVSSRRTGRGTIRLAQESGLSSVGGGRRAIPDQTDSVLVERIFSTGTTPYL
jgi:hypothetical protein